MTVRRAAAGRPSAWVLMGAVFCVTSGGLSARQAPALTDPALQDARRAYDATDFEAARALLTARISELNTPEPDAARRRQLATALELRGRTLQNLRDIEAARADFRSMLLLVPDYPFPAEAGARARALFEEVRATTVGMVEVQLSPADAELRIDGELVTGRPVRLSLADGTHVAAASRASHRPLETLFMVRAGEMATLPLALERIASTVTVTTAPAEVDVLLDGTLRGRTEPDGAASKPFAIDGLAPGRYVVGFRRPCHVPEQRVLDLQQVQALRLDDIRLAPATAAVAVRTDAPEATVFVDGARAGAAPQQLTLCEGTHVVEVRTAWGRDVRRLNVKTGEKTEFAALVRPALALAPASAGSAADTTAARAAVERDLGASMAVKLFVPVEGTTELPAQGVATVRSDAAGVVTLSLLAPGSTRPDVVSYRAGDPESISEVIGRLDDAPPLTRIWLGLLPIDVLDVGVVVGKVDGALATSFRPGDVLTAADGKPLGTVADLRAMAGARGAGQPLPVDVRDPAGVPRRAQLVAHQLPRVISPDDRTVLPNTLAVTLTARARRAPASALERAAVHLNLAVAWMHLQSWMDATAALDAVDAVQGDASLAQDVRGAIAGTSAYLRGIVLEQSGDAPGAARAFARASQSTGPMLIEGIAGSLADLVARRQDRPAP